MQVYCPLRDFINRIDVDFDISFQIHCLQLITYAWMTTGNTCVAKSAERSKVTSSWLPLPPLHTHTHTHMQGLHVVCMAGKCIALHVVIYSHYLNFIWTALNTASFWQPHTVSNRIKARIAVSDTGLPRPLKVLESPWIWDVVLKNPGMGKIFTF